MLFDVATRTRSIEKTGVGLAAVLSLLLLFACGRHDKGEWSMPRRVTPDATCIAVAQRDVPLYRGGSADNDCGRLLETGTLAKGHAIAIREYPLTWWNDDLTPACQDMARVGRYDLAAHADLLAAHRVPMPPDAPQKVVTQEDGILATRLTGCTPAKAVERIPYKTAILPLSTDGRVFRLVHGGALFHTDETR